MPFGGVPLMTEGTPTLMSEDDTDGALLPPALNAVTVNE